MQPTEIITTDFGDTIYRYGHHGIWVPFDRLKQIVEKYHIRPEIGSGECGFESFCEYLSLLPASRYIGKNGDDIDSLVGMFDDDLKTFANISKNSQNKK